MSHDNKKQEPEHRHKHIRAIMGGRRIVLKNGKRYIEKCAGYEVFKCVIPGCPHYTSTEMAVGKKSTCWVCNQELILSNENLKLKKPTHIWCRRIREQFTNTQEIA